MNKVQLTVIGIGVTVTLFVVASQYVLTEDDLALDKGPDIPDAWTSQVHLNETRHRYHPSTYDCTLSITQEITEEERYVTTFVTDCADSVSSYKTYNGINGTSMDVKSIFEDFEFILEDIPFCSWDMLYSTKSPTNITETSGIILSELYCTIFDKHLIDLYD